MEIDELRDEKRFPKKLNKEFFKSSADYYLKQENLPLALDEIDRLIKLTKNKKQKARLHYISVQIFQKHNQ